MNIFTMTKLTEKDLIRYQRQIIIPEFGIKAQKKLKSARVVVAGAGGLGSAALTYLAMAGIGDITIIDHDKVELSNLNRQTLHWEKDIGRSKAESALEKIKQINPDIKVTAIHEKITADNVFSLLKGAHAIIDCMDNFETRYILNDAAIKLDIPLFHAACYSFEGRVTTMIPKKTPCLRCIFPEKPLERKCPVVGAVAGMTGTIQAAEVIKYFTGIGDLLQGKLMVFDAMFMRYELVDIKRNPKCPDCGVP